MVTENGSEKLQMNCSDVCSLWLRDTTLPCNWRCSEQTKTEYVTVVGLCVCVSALVLNFVHLLTSVWCPMGLFTWVQCKQCLTLKCKRTHNSKVSKRNRTSFEIRIFNVARTTAFSIQRVYLRVIRAKNKPNVHLEMRFYRLHCCHQRLSTYEMHIQVVCMHY